MPNIIINFFGEEILLERPKNLISLRNAISRFFCLTKQDASEIILLYKENGRNKIISNDEDLKKFLASKSNKIILDINQDSKIYVDNYNKLTKEKKMLEEFINKKEELSKLKKLKYNKEKKEIKEIEMKINTLTQRKKEIMKEISEGIKKIDKELNEVNEKIENLQKKISVPEKKLKSFHCNIKQESKIKTYLKSKQVNISQKNKINLLSSANDWEITDETQATGSYADWRNNAIVSPTKGQLLPAGFVTIKFSALNDAQKYEAYVDYDLIKTFEKGNNLEFEIRNNEVKKHNTFIVATLSNGEEVISNVRYFFISKKGIGIWQSQVDQIKAMNITWYYDWSVTPLSNDSGEYVPMIWGNASETSTGDRKKEWDFIQKEEWKNHRYLLMFNEPDFPDQANMSPEQAVERWKYIQPIVDDEKVDVSSPVVAIPTVFYEDDNNDYQTVGGWFGKYKKLMAEEKYNDEFTAVHFYFDYPGEWVVDILKRIHEFTGKKIWLTEWGVAQWSQVQNFDWVGGPDEGNWQRELVAKFVQEILPILDETDYIERYAWFPFDGSNTEKFGNGAGGLFFNTESDPLYKQLTLVGKAYKEYGNPQGWDPNKTTNDQVIKRKGNDDDDTRQNILSGKKITASSVTGDNVANNAIDSDVKTRWESQHGKDDPEWIMIELGDSYKVDGFRIVWENAAAKEYKIQISTNGNEWKDIYEVKEGKSGEIYEANFDSVTAKYIRLIGASKTLPDYGYSIYDFQIFGVLEANKLKNNKKEIKRMNKDIVKDIVHKGVQCKGCGKTSIKGYRYKCAICSNVNYCEICEKKFGKKHNHPFLFFYSTKSRPIFLKNLANE